jgi:hypothetical protein
MLVKRCDWASRAKRGLTQSANAKRVIGMRGYADTKMHPLQCRKIHGCARPHLGSMSYSQTIRFCEVIRRLSVSNLSIRFVQWPAEDLRRLHESLLTVGSPPAGASNGWLHSRYPNDVQPNPAIAHEAAASLKQPSNIALPCRGLHLSITSSFLCLVLCFVRCVSTSKHLNIAACLPKLCRNRKLRSSSQGAHTDS